MRAMSGAIGTVRRRTLLAVVIAGVGVGLASTALAQAGPVDLKVVDRETSRELPVWRHGGRMFVAGRPGDRYSLRVRNRTKGRLLLVLSVDGVNVVSGDTASYQQSGYVLDAHAAYDVTGWRKSQAEVAAFTFAALPRSYAALTGRPGEVGVIGLAAFKERVAPEASNREPAPVRPEPRRLGRRPPRPDLPPPPPPPPLPIPPIAAPLREAPATASSPSARAGPSSAPQSPTEATVASRRDEKLGTGHGARESSTVTFTAFERATAYPQAVWRIEYDTYPNLVARGVVDPPPYADGQPRPFPQEPEPAGFVPDPPGVR